MTQYEVNPDIFRTIETQIIQNEPTCARLAFNQLMELGFSQMETLELMGSVFVRYMNDIMMYGKKFEEADYAMQLEALVRKCSGEEGPEVTLDPIEQDKHAGYDALMEGNADEMVSRWFAGVEKVKELAAKEFAGERMSLSEVEEKTAFRYGLLSWFGDIERELGVAKRQEERVRFCKEMMDTFTWNDEALDGFKSAIGEAYCDMGNQEACMAWFEEWLKEAPGNCTAVNSYLYALMTFKELDRAKEVAESQIDDSLECDLDTETMFYRAQSLFEATGDSEKAAVYRDKIAAFHEKCLSFAKAYEAGKASKVYPNDLCPCGSGKKYKKCCGK